MNKIKIKILESATSKGCKHDFLTCRDCGSVIMMREPKKFNTKRFIALAKKIQKIEQIKPEEYNEEQRLNAERKNEEDRLRAMNKNEEDRLRSEFNKQYEH